MPQAEAVPIDSIVVIHFDCTARINGGAAVTTTNPSGAVDVPIATPPGPPAPAVRRGEDFFTYRITGVTLDHGVTAGELPIVWWPNEPSPTSESKRELALLTRVPDAHPCAVERSKHLDDLLSQTWDTVCDEIAPATSVLWTFHETPLGPSTVGWVLTGTAWPDPPGSTRSVAPDLRLDLAETWRTGDPALDLSVNIAPARVIGGAVQCDERCARRIPTHRLPAVPGRELLTIAAARGVAANAELARFAVLSCWAHVLEAPFLRHQNLDPLVKHPLGEILIKLAQEAAAQRLDPLDDIVAIKTEPIVRFRALLAVPDLVLHARALTVRLFADDGGVLDEFPVDGSGSSRLVKRARRPAAVVARSGRAVVLPSRGGAAVPAGRGRQATAAAPRAGRHRGLRRHGLCAARHPECRSPDGGGAGRPSYLLGVVETLAAAEVGREQHDTLVKNSKITVIDGALADPADQPALLLPNTEYTVAVAWQWTTCDENGNVPSTATWTTAAAQSFHFRTDNAPLAPRTLQVANGPAQVMPVRLDPWVLLTDPFDNDHFFFYGDKVRVVFAVDYLLHMFDTYGVDIEAKVRAASFKNADPASPNFAKTLQALGPATAVPLKGANVFTPWEDTIRGIVADLPCIDASGAVSRHQLLDLDLLPGAADGLHLRHRAGEPARATPQHDRLAAVPPWLHDVPL